MARSPAHYLAYVLFVAAFASQGSDEVGPADLAGSGSPHPLQSNFKVLGGHSKTAQDFVFFAPKSVGQQKPTSFVAEIGVPQLVAAVMSAEERRIKWTAAREGHFATLSVTSRGAAALRVGIRVRGMAPGMEVRVGSHAEGLAKAVLLSSAHLLSNFESPESLIWTPVTSGDRQVIELWMGSGAPQDSELYLEAVSHLTVDPLEESWNAKGKLLSCHQNFSCTTNPTAISAGRAVAKLVITTTQGSTFSCTGALLNDRASTGTAWLATADHCGINSQAVASNVQFIWSYERSCSTGAPTSSSTTIGSQLLLSDPSVDFTLLRITGALPSGLRLLGWNAGEAGIGTPMFGIHHPDGTYKAISAGTKVDQGPISFRGENQTWSISAQAMLWEVGVTEPGSSGSPLLSTDGALRGTLSAGPIRATCATATLALYSRFSQAYPKIRGWIDPPSTVSDDWANTPAATQTSQLVPFDTTTQNGTLNTATDQDWFRFSFSQPGTVLLYSSDYQGLRTNTYGRVFRSDGTTLLSENNDDPTGTLGSHFLFFAHAQAGTYYLQVTGYQGAVGPYVVNSLYVPDDDHNDFYFLGSNLPANGSLAGSLSRSGDLDNFIIDVPASGQLRLASSGSTDVVGYLYDANHQLIDSNDDVSYPTNLNFSIERQVSPGRYYLTVIGYDVTTQGPYSISSSLSTASGNENYTALWWNPNEPGWGININHQGNTLFGTLFTYAQDRFNRWLVASNLEQQQNGAFTGPLYLTSLPTVNLAQWTSPLIQQVGSMTINFIGPSQATIAYSVNGVGVVKTIQKQVFGVSAPTCTSTTASRANETNYQDLWWNPSEPGWGMNIAHQGQTLFVTLFIYDSTGRDLWLVGSNISRQLDGRFSGPLYITAGPPFNSSPWSAIELAQVGDLSLRFLNGESAELSYTFSGVSVTRTIQRQVFGSSRPVCR